MNRKLMRWSLLLLIFLAMAYTAGPSLAGFIGISVPDPMETFVEKGSKLGPCTDDGVTLVVDYGTAASKLVVVCATHYGQSREDSGWGLFAAANQDVTGTSDYPAGFVCRINGYPSSKVATCDSTTNLGPGRWAYFKAVDSRGWRYSHIGAAMDEPVCGNWEGWRYVRDGNSSTGVPRITPKPFKCST